MNDLFRLGLALLAAQAALPSQTTQWQPLSPSPVRRFEAAIAVHEGRLYVLGGFGPGTRATSRVDRYDPQTDTWSQLADMPRALTHVNAVLDGDLIWIAGGFEATGRGPAVADVWKYDIAGNSFEAGLDLPEKRAGGGLARVGRTLHYISGLTEDRDTDSPDHWTLDLDGGTEWTSAPPMPEPRNQFGVAVVETRIYVIGGQFHHDRRDGQPLRDVPLVQVFDTGTGEWTEGPPAPVGFSHFEPSIFVHRGGIVVVGGRSGQEALPQIRALSLDSSEWRELGKLPRGLLAPFAGVIDGRLLVGGGALAGYVAQDAMWSASIGEILVDGDG